jgi:hypothetical protein
MDDDEFDADRMAKHGVVGFYRGVIFGAGYSIFFGSYYLNKQGLKTAAIMRAILGRSWKIMFFFGLYMGTANFIYNSMLDRKQSNVVSMGAAMGAGYLLMTMTERFWVFK